MVHVAGFGEAGRLSCNAEAEEKSLGYVFSVPIERFESLPDNSRVWVYAARNEVTGERAAKLLSAVDGFLSQWTAHGTPLHAARDWRDDRFLTIAVDQTKAGASGCSIDGLFRILKGLESELGTELITSALVFYRDQTGRVRAVTREEFEALASRGEIDESTEVFDTSVISLGEWRARFASRAGDSWHAAFLRRAAAT
jgi:hypothetical protein